MLNQENVDSLLDREGELATGDTGKAKVTISSLHQSLHQQGLVGLYGYRQGSKKRIMIH